MDKINWREWNDDAFTESKESGKLVLLDISAVWCHWCHVMDETTYSNQKIIDLINENYIPIRVDNDRNPDINSRYNMGGWPTTAFLTYNRDIIFGATYIPPDKMLQVLTQVTDAYKEQGDALVRKASDARLDAETKLGSAKPGKSGRDDVNAILDIIRSSYDSSYGGFGLDQKFPHTSALNLLMFDYERTHNEQDLRIVTDTLEAMLGGDIFDIVEGGMFRYATRRDWTAPHYEKLLDDNANMASVFLDAYRITQREEFIQEANEIFRYLETTLFDEASGGYFGSQDADEEYYQRDIGGRRELQKPRVDTALYTDSNASLAMAYIKLYGVTEDHVARDQAVRIVNFFNALPKGKDGTVCHFYENGGAHLFGDLVDSVNLALANLMCYEATGSDSYLTAAKSLSESIITAFRSDTGGLFDISSNLAGERAFTRYSIPLSENAAAASSFLKLANLTGDEKYRMYAREMLDILKDSYQSYGILAADYAVAVALLHLAPVVINVKAAVDDPKRDQFIHASLTACGSRCTINSSDLEEDIPKAEVCVGVSCRIHVTDPDELAEELTHVVDNEQYLDE